LEWKGYEQDDPDPTAALLDHRVIPPYGMEGAAIAWVIGYTALFLAMQYKAHRVFPVPYQWRGVTTRALVAGLLTGVGSGSFTRRIVA
jgi:O-antigen/teichoic acid export membrane protein